MKFHELFETRLLKDNPGGEWLETKRERAASFDRRPSGAPHLGSVTGYFNGYVKMPVAFLKNIPGYNQEEKNVRIDSLKWLKNHMQETGKLPTDSYGHEMAPFIAVDFEGNPWVMEGNHRIMAASLLGWKYMPVEIRYFDGGEEIKDGPLYPKNWGWE